MGNYKLLSDLESHTVFIYRESKRINVKNIYPVFKYFKIVLASKSKYSKQQPSKFRC